MRKSVNPFVWPLRYGLKTKGFEGASEGCWFVDSLPFRSFFELISALVVCDFGGFSANFTGALSLAFGLTSGRAIRFACGAISDDFPAFHGPINKTCVFPF